MPKQAASATCTLGARPNAPFPTVFTSVSDRAAAAPRGRAAPAYSSVTTPVPPQLGAGLGWFLGTAARA